MSDRVAVQNRIVIVGGGLSGLVAAHRIRTKTAGSRRPLEVILLEAKNRLGGAIWTEHQDGFLLEGGADSFITNKPAALNLCKELGLGDQLIGPDATNRRSFVVKDGKLLPVPEGFVLMAPQKIGPILTTPILSFRGKLRMLMDLVVPRRTDDSDESLASFVKRRLGREALDRLVQPLVGGIYTADPNELSVKATLPHFVEMEKKYGSLIRGAIGEMKKNKNVDKNASGARYGLFASLIDGMETLPKALAASLPPGTIRKNSPVRRVSRSDSGTWLVEPLDGPPIEAAGVIMALIPNSHFTCDRSPTPRRRLSSPRINATRSPTRSTASARSCRLSRAGASSPSPSPRSNSPAGPLKTRFCCASSSAVRPSPNSSTSTTLPLKRLSRKKRPNCWESPARRCSCA